jgi:type IV fimbrial biogenesis protein FimT
MNDIISKPGRALRGVTLVELMVGLAVIGIILMTAVPSFTGMINRNRATTQVNDFVLAIQIARSEASRMGSTVSIQAVGADGSNEFGEGFCVVAGNPGDCAGTAIRRFDTLTGSSTLNSVEDVTSIQFDSLGGLAGTGGLPLQFDLCNDSTPGRRIFVSLIGRTKVHTPEDLDAAKRPGC